MELNSTQQVCSVGIDNTFGPYAGRSCRGGFDFTLYFEEGILIILPAALLIAAVPFRIYNLVQRKKKVVEGGSLLTAKLVSFTSSE
jgi:hypothetical protein